MEFGERFKLLRIEKNLNQQELCNDFYKMFGHKLSKSSISQYENNKRTPEINILICLANYFNVTLDYLLLGNRKDKSLHSDNILHLSNICFNSPDIPRREKDIIFKEISMIYFDSLGI